MAVKKGDTVYIHYIGTLESGDEFDNSYKRKKPIEFVVGAGKVIKGFDDAVVGMKKGEKKKISIPPKEAYGEHDPALIQKVPRDKLPQKLEPKVGMVLTLKDPQNRMLFAKIVDVNAKDVSIDINHPLAGQTLNFELELVKIE